MGVVVQVVLWNGWKNQGFNNMKLSASKSMERGSLCRVKNQKVISCTHQYRSETIQYH